MSLHRENTIWQSANGSWNIGFNEVLGYNGPDREWDVEYGSEFEWVSTGHSTEEAAARSYDGANPGGSMVVPYNPQDGERTDRLNDLAGKAYDRHLAKKYSKGYRGTHTTYRGPQIARPTYLIARELHQLKREALSHRLGGYSNQPSPNIPALEKLVDGRIREASHNEERARELNRRLNIERENHLLALRDMEERTEKRFWDDRRWRNPIAADRRNALEELKREIAVEAEPYVALISKEARVPPQATSPMGTASKTSYHINPSTGRANKCNAGRRACPFGGPGEHYSSREQARSAYEKKMKVRSLPSVAKKR